MVYSRNYGTISLAFCPNPNNLGEGNYKDLDKMSVKLFPNFTRHHLITHTYFKTFTSTYYNSNKRKRLTGVNQNSLLNTYKNTNLILKTTERMIYKVLSNILLSASISSTIATVSLLR